MIVICGAEPRDRNIQDLDRLLADDQFVNRQIGCVLGRSRCDQFGKNLKGKEITSNEIT